MAKSTAKSTDKRKLRRKNFTYYMRVMDEVSGKFIGQLIDISTGGFKVECAQQIPLNRQIKLRIDQTGEISDRSYIVFMGVAKWCQQDTYDLSAYNVGFQITDMSPADYDIFLQMFNKYGMEKKAHERNDSDYFWR